MSFGQKMENRFGGGGFAIMEEIGADNGERAIGVGMGHSFAQRDCAFDRCMAANQYYSRRCERRAEFNDPLRRERYQQLSFDRICENEGIERV